MVIYASILQVNIIMENEMKSARNFDYAPDQYTKCSFGKFQLFLSKKKSNSSVRSNIQFRSATRYWMITNQKKFQNFY